MKIRFSTNFHSFFPFPLRFVFFIIKKNSKEVLTTFSKETFLYETINRFFDCSPPQYINVKVFNHKDFKKK